MRGMKESEKIQLEIARLQEQLGNALARNAAAMARESVVWSEDTVMLGTTIVPSLRDSYRYCPFHAYAAEVEITTDDYDVVSVYFSDMCAFVDGIREKIAAGGISWASLRPLTWAIRSGSSTPPAPRSWCGTILTSDTNLPAK